MPAIHGTLNQKPGKAATQTHHQHLESLKHAPMAKLRAVLAGACLLNGPAAAFGPAAAASSLRGTGNAVLRLGAVSAASASAGDGAASRPSEDGRRDALLALLDSVPSNAPTPNSLTESILASVRELEGSCPTEEGDVLAELAGNWELLWTAQDRESAQANRGILSWINPLENQSYANNPGGRANPILPREIQDRLEGMGILEPSGGGSAPAPVRSTQAIDLKLSRVRNVVRIELRRPFPVRGSLVVDVAFRPNGRDRRRIDVKFEACRVRLRDAADFVIPLGIVGPTGWLRTGYVDDRIRITRGHKGSVFVLSRTATRRKET